MSLGVESRIGLGFDRHRTQSACCTIIKNIMLIIIIFIISKKVS